MIFFVDIWIFPPYGETFKIVSQSSFMAQKKRLVVLKAMQETSALYKVGKTNVEENDKTLIKLIKL